MRSLSLGEFRGDRGAGNPSSWRDRAGMSIVYMLFVIPVLIFAASIAVDIGRIRVAKGIVQTGADAAAMGAVMTLPQLRIGVTGDWDFPDIDQTAIDLAAANPITVDGVAVQLQPSVDIEYGMWDRSTRTFTFLGHGGSPGGIGDPRMQANAVRVRSWRSSARGNSLPLTVARFFNQNSRDVTSIATAMVAESGNPTLGIIGLNGVDSNGTKAIIDSYLPELGLYENQPRRENAMVGSNKTVHLGNSDIYGSVRYGRPPYTIDRGPTSYVTGWIGPLTEDLVFPPVTVPAEAQPLPNQGPGPFTVTAGTYRVNNWPQKKYIFVGPVKIYVTGTMQLQSQDAVWGLNKIPANLELYLTSSANLRMIGGASLYAHFYGPGAPVRINGNGNRFYGSMIAEKIDYIGTADIHYDESLPTDPNIYSRVVIVK